MSCISPILVSNSQGTILAPCGRCLSCCIAKQSALEFLCKKELQTVYKRGLGASFVTLTYDDNHVPYVATDSPYQTLVKRDFDLFNKRVRRYIERDNMPTIKFVAAGEYGDSLGRPHYHVVYFGLTDFLADRYVSKSWQYGLYQVGALSAGGLRYVLKYMTKSRPDRDIERFYASVGVEKPFIKHSHLLGFDWIQNHAKDIADDGYVFTQRGKKRLYPGYVRKIVESLTGVDPRPYVDKYLKSIDTGDMSYDDYMATKVYYNEVAQRKQMIQDGKPYYLPTMCRRPPELRFNADNVVDVSELVNDVVGVE